MKYNNSPNVGAATRFSRSPMAEVEFSRMTAMPQWLLPFNAGDIVPVYYSEVLPHDTFDISLDFIIRQNTLLRPVMGNLQVDFYAYFVPNRIINDSWKNVMGENTSGVWAAPEVDLAPLYVRGASSVQIPVGSVADYYGFPTQLPMHASVLEQCNDLKFRGYLEIYNNYFRDENYEPPIPYSKLNVYNGFLERQGNIVPLAPNTSAGGGWSDVPRTTSADGSYAAGSIVKEIYGDGATGITSNISLPARLSSWSALSKPLKANKLHDYFTSGLPSPQKGPEVYFGIGETAPVSLDTATTVSPFESGNALKLLAQSANGNRYLSSTTSGTVQAGDTVVADGSFTFSDITSSNLVGIADLSQVTGVSINDLRTAIATQQVYETLARGGSRYVSMLKSFFEIETENPFMDIPLELGHLRRDLDNYQVAQTSATNEESPQGSLAAYGYTNKDGHLFTRTFLEHGYIHIFAIVRQRNVYSSYFAPDNFRKTTMDFYLPQFANIGEQPLRLALLNPFREDSMERVLAYQEAWAEYRYEPDRVHGLFRSGIDGSLDSWNLADNFDSGFEVIDRNFIKSNAEEVINRTIAVTSALAPQFKGQFVWKVDKQRPMPVYSIPGLDTI